MYLPTPPSWPEVPMLYFFDVSASPTDVFFTTTTTIIIKELGLAAKMEA